MVPHIHQHVVAATHDNHDAVGVIKEICSDGTSIVQFDSIYIGYSELLPLSRLRDYNTKEALSF